MINKLPPKIMDVIFLILVAVMYTALCAEADLYVSAFPQMIRYFGIEENKIQLILSINFLGLFLAGLFIGPLSESYGRKKVLLAGLLLLIGSSVGCIFTTNFHILLGWRFLQGIGASAPMILSGTMFFDKYPLEKAEKLVGFLNSFISAAIIGAPIVGACISQIFQWRSNFFVILFLAIISFIGSLIGIEETLPLSQRKKFNLKTIGLDYLKLTKNPQFMGYIFITNFSFIALVIYIANIPLILINHMQGSVEEFSTDQAKIMGTFILFFFISIKFIEKKGVDYTKDLGGFLAIIGSIGMAYVGAIDPINLFLINLSMAFIAAGGAFMSGTFGAKALGMFPGMSGKVMAMMTTTRQLLALALVILSEIMFDGTIVPVSELIAFYAIIATMWYGFIHIKN